MRWFKAGMGFALIALLATGCIRVEGNITINDDGTGTVELLNALDTESVLGALADFDLPESEVGGTDELCEDFSVDQQDTSDFPPGAQVVPYEEDGFCGTRVTFDLAASTDHSAALGGVFGGETVRLFKEGENWIFETSLDLDDAMGDTEGIPPGLVDTLFEGASFTFVVDLPGRAIDGQNNATSVGSDGRFEWDIDLLNPPTRLFAQTEPGSGGGDGGGGGGLGLILIIVAIVVLVAAGAWWFLTQRKKDSSGPSTPPLGSAGSTPPPAAAPPQAASAPPAVADQAVRPANPEAQATVAMPAAGGAPASNDPVWDPSLNAWVIHDPVQGKLVHDAATNSWRPA